MHNMVMAMKAARESAGIGTFPLRMQAGMASAKSRSSSPSNDKAKFASSAFKHGPAPTHVPLPARWGNAEVDDVSDDEQITMSKPLPLHTEGSSLYPMISPTCAQEVIEAKCWANSKVAQDVIEAKFSESLDERPDARANFTNENKVAIAVAYEPLHILDHSSPGSLSPKSVGPSPSSVLGLATKKAPRAEKAKTYSGNSDDMNTSRRPPKGSRAKKTSNVAGANAISERINAFGGKRQQSGSTQVIAQHTPAKLSLPGGIKLPSAVAKLLPDASTNRS